MRRSSRVFIVGLVLVVLGLANLMIGSSKVTQYQAAVESAQAAGGPEVTTPMRDTTSMLEPATDARFLYESATIKLDYYLVVHRGGRLLTLLGCVLAIGAIVRRILVPSSNEAAV